MTLPIAAIARICHEANRALCFSVGDVSQVSWDDAPAWQRQSAVAGITYLMEHPDATSETLHEHWVKDKRREGWAYGDVKSASLRTHPCMVPYDQLPEFQRYKDKLFLAIVRSLQPTEPALACGACGAPVAVRLPSGPVTVLSGSLVCGNSQMSRCQSCMDKERRNLNATHTLGAHP